MTAASHQGVKQATPNLAHRHGQKAHRTNQEARRNCQKGHENSQEDHTQPGRSQKQPGSAQEQPDSTQTQPGSTQKQPESFQKQPGSNPVTARKRTETARKLSETAWQQHRHSQEAPSRSHLRTWPDRYGRTTAEREPALFNYTSFPPLAIPVLLSAETAKLSLLKIRAAREAQQETDEKKNLKKED